MFQLNNIDFLLADMNSNVHNGKRNNTKANILTQRDKFFTVLLYYEHQQPE